MLTPIPAVAIAAEPTETMIATYASIVIVSYLS
jgi:hypothetical protein